MTFSNLYHGSMFILVTTLMLQMVACDSPVGVDQEDRTISFTDPTIVSILQNSEMDAMDRMVKVINSEMPNFGGLYFREDTIFIFDTTPEDVSPTGRGVNSVLAKGFGVSDPGYPVTVVEGKYTLAELNSYRHSVREVFRMVEGINSMFIDKRINRLRLHLVDDHALDAILAAVGNEVPQDAIKVSYGAPYILEELRDHPKDVGTQDEQIIEPPPPPPGGGISPAETLESKLDYIAGGARINRGGTNGCSVGLVVEDEFHNRHIVTASHCTQDLHEMTSTVFYQPNPSEDDPDPHDDENRIAVEVSDPWATTEPLWCYPGHICRYTDTALLAIDFHIQSEVGVIFETAGVGSNETTGGEIAIDSDRWPISWEPVHMTGSKSGQISGEHVANCADINPVDSDGQKYHYHCLGVSDYASQGGDSGAPVYHVTFDGNRLLGFHSFNPPQDDWAYYSRPEFSVGTYTYSSIYGGESGEVQCAAPEWGHTGTVSELCADYGEILEFRAESFR